MFNFLFDSAKLKHEIRLLQMRIQYLGGLMAKKDQFIANMIDKYPEIIPEYRQALKAWREPDGQPSEKKLAG